MSWLDLKKIENVEEWYDERSQGKQSDSLLIDEIKSIRTQQDWNETDALIINSLLVGELQLQNRLDEAISFLRAETQNYPENPRPLMSLSNTYFYYAENSGKALNIIDKALPIAYSSRQFYREALGHRARVALKLERYDILSDCIEKIISYGKWKGQIDIGMEHDFVDRALDKLSKKLVERYVEFVNAPSPQKRPSE